MAEPRGRKPRGGKRINIRIPAEVHEEVLTYTGATKVDASVFLGDAIAAWWATAPEKKKALEMLEILKEGAKKAS